MPGGARLGPLRGCVLDAAAEAREPIAHSTTTRVALAIARIEAHYFVNDAFLAEDELLGDLDRIRHMPCTIVQGRYDVVCPPVTADALPAPGPRPSTSSCPTPATRCASRASRASWSRPCAGMQDRLAANALAR